jgi:putative transposase
VPNCPHHVTQRGNRRQQTFFRDDDYRAYLDLLVEWCGRHEVRIWAYCLMPNQPASPRLCRPSVHLIVVPPTGEALCRAIGEVNRRYTRMVNFRKGWRGHLWQGRFSSFPMDSGHLLAAARYVERNPVKAKLVGTAAAWPWSSAAAHVSGKADGIAETAWLAERTAGWVCTWAEHLRKADEKDFAAMMRLHENTGRPLGDKRFLRKLESLLGRTLLPGKPGRPRKVAAKEKGK